MISVMTSKGSRVPYLYRIIGLLEYLLGTVSGQKSAPEAILHQNLYISKIYYST